MKRLLAIFLMVGILMCSVPALAAMEGDLMRVVNCDEWVSLREMPSTKADRVEKVPKNAIVVYLENARNGFAYVQYGDQYGYILREYLTQQDVMVLEVGNCDEWVSLRTYPSTAAIRLLKIPKGELVRFIGTSYDGYFCVEYDGVTGYVASQYLMGSDLVQGTIRQVVRCDEWISLRSAPSTKAARLARIPLNAMVISLYSVGNMEYVCYEGQYGYVLSEYLRDVLTFGW